tara:strand:- start:3 stop:920 length:918 start_codon:yes stop_codon:yes gene_type:complete
LKTILKILKPKNLIIFLSKPRLVFISIKYHLKKIFFDTFFLFKRGKYKYNFIFIAGMPMSATTKVKNMCARIDGYFTRYSPIPEEIFLNQDITDSAFRYCPSWGYTLFKTHLNPWERNIQIIKKNKVKKVIVTYRDLRDVVVARYNRLLMYPKKKNEPLFNKDSYNSISKSEGINHCIDIVTKHYIKWIYGWLEIKKKENDFILLCKFEDLINNPKQEFTKILDFYEIKLDESKIDFIVEATKGKQDLKTNMDENKILPYGLSTNFRSGKIGNWKTEFDNSNISKFKKLGGEALIKLNYEKDLNW